MQDTSRMMTGSDASLPATLPSHPILAYGPDPELPHPHPRFSCIHFNRRSLFIARLQAHGGSCDLRSVGWGSTEPWNRPRRRMSRCTTSSMVDGRA